MRDYSVPRYFKLKDGLTVEISFLPFAGRWMAVIRQSNGENWIPTEWPGSHATSAVKALKRAKLLRRLEIDPKFKAVYERLVPSHDTLTVETLRRLKEKLLMTDKDKHPMRVHTNSKTARYLKEQLELYRASAKLAGLNLPLIFEDDSIEDGKAYKE